MRKFQKISILDKYNLREEDVILPKRATKYSAGYDFYNPMENIVLEPQQDITIPTGVKVLMPRSNLLLIVPRSGLGFKYFLRLANTIGIIDADYYDNPDNEGCIFIKLRNEGNKPITINKGDRIAQGIFVSYLMTEDDEGEGERVGGISSTGN